MSNEMTILLYTDESTAGGVAHYNHGLLPALLAAGWRTFSAQPPNANPMLVEQRKLGIQQRFLSYDPVAAFARSFTDTTDPERIMAEIKPDLIYFSDCCPLSNMAAKHVAITRQIPFVVISHSAADYLAQRFPACLPIAKRQLEMARDVIAISQKNLDVLHNFFGLTKNKGKVVLNGRPASFFNPPDQLVRRRIRAELNVPEDGVLCFTSARFDTAKGYQHQFAAIRQLQAKNSLGKLYFAWAGIGDRQAEFAQAVKTAGLDSRIRLLGQRWDIAALLDASDLFVLTTMLEGGLPLSVMEAMAKGVATIVTSVSGIAGVAQGACQLLPDPNTQPNDTVSALATALDTLARDPAQRAKLSQAGRVLAEQSFRQETNLTQTLAILEASIQADPASKPFLNSTPTSPVPKTKSASPAPGNPMTKEAFLLKPDFSGQDWQKIVLAYIQAFSPGDPVGLIIQADATSGGPLTPSAVQEKVLDIVRSSGLTAFADILLIENPGDLVATLRNFSLIHRLPCLDESTVLHTPAMELLRSALAGKLPTRRPAGPARDEPENSPAPASPPLAPQRMLTIVDYAVQPYSIGDFLVYLMGSMAAAGLAEVEKVDLCLLSDPSRPPIDPIMREQVTAQNHYSHLISFLPMAELHPYLGALMVFDSADELNAYLVKSGGLYKMWPGAAALAAKQYMFYDNFKLIKEHHQQRGAIPQFKFNPLLADWANAFFQKHAPQTVPVTINLRNNPNFHTNRNYILQAWKEFFERCQDNVPVKFIVTCAASEVDASLRSLPNVVFAKDNQSTLMQDLSLIRFAAFHLGSSSGPIAIPIFGDQPYHVFNCDAVAHIANYGGSLIMNDAGEMQFSFAKKLQTFGVVPETADGIWQQFEKIWTSQDWPGDWLLPATEAKQAPAASLA